MIAEYFTHDPKIRYDTLSGRSTIFYFPRNYLKIAKYFTRDPKIRFDTVSGRYTILYFS